MAIEVRIPTILRTYTGGEKAVSGEGSTLSELIESLEASHPGLKERLVDGADLLDDLDARHAGIKARLVTEDGGLHRFVNVYVNDEDVRFLGGLSTPLKDGDSVTVLPAVAGGAR